MKELVLVIGVAWVLGGFLIAPQEFIVMYDVLTNKPIDPLILECEKMATTTDSMRNCERLPLKALSK